MMVIRPVERSDVSALMQLASKTGGGLTSLPANEATLSARIERAIKTWQGELPKSEQGYVFVLEDSEYSAAIFLIPICISFDTAEKRRYATYLILNRRFSFEF